MLLHGGITPIKAFQVPLRGRARVNKNGLFVCETLEQWQSCDTTSENNGGTYFHFFIFSIFVNVRGNCVCRGSHVPIQSLFFAPFIQSAKYWSNYQK